MEKKQGWHLSCPVSCWCFIVKVCPMGPCVGPVGYYSFFIVNYMEYAGRIMACIRHMLCGFFAAGV
jgi:hypothetical protein